MEIPRSCAKSSNCSFSVSSGVGQFLPAQWTGVERTDSEGILCQEWQAYVVRLCRIREWKKGRLVADILNLTMYNYLRLSCFKLGIKCFVTGVFVVQTVLINASMLYISLSRTLSELMPTSRKNINMLHRWLKWYCHVQRCLSICPSLCPSVTIETVIPLALNMNPMYYRQSVPIGSGDYTDLL